MVSVALTFTMDSAMGVRKNKRIPWSGFQPEQFHIQMSEGKVCIGTLQTFVTMMELVGPHTMKEIGDTRVPIVVADENLDIPNVKVVNSLRDALNYGYELGRDIVIIASFEEYEEFKDDLTEIHVSVVPGVYNCDENAKYIMEDLKERFTIEDVIIAKSGINFVTYKRNDTDD